MRCFGTCVPCGMVPGVKTPGYFRDVPPGQSNAEVGLSANQKALQNRVEILTGGLRTNGSGGSFHLTPLSGLQDFQPWQIHRWRVGVLFPSTKPRSRNCPASPTTGIADR